MHIIQQASVLINRLWEVLNWSSARSDRGKWVAQGLTILVHIDGYLRPDVSPNYEADETGYQDITDSLEAIDAGASYQLAAGETSNVMRYTLIRIDDSERQS
ncbi:hypothetical protein EI982_08650 [Haloplanus rallus]|uniref:Uncharacterized protein n=1 Tax=Haloplanus rallus TaxID=1816183 RepID=A0A6B9FFY1_9EURY|nr:hypothetical protein [Haloplanus rallus]QGX94853.1 hypothetical protein EI982_08650 [Haloplanus rallus]